MPDSAGDQSAAVDGNTLFQPAPKPMDGNTLFQSAGDAQSPSAGPAPVAGAQLFGGGAASPQFPSAPQPDSSSQPFSQMPSGENLAKAAGVGTEDYNAVSNLIKSGASGINKALTPLTIPIRAAASAVAAIANVPGARAQIRQGSLPNTMWSDLTDLMVDKASKAMGLDQMGDNFRLLSQGVKTGIGAVANILGDPLMYSEVGTLTKAAEELQKVGDYSNVAASTERNLLAIKATPWAKESIPLVKMAALDPVAGAIMKVPGAQKAFDATSSIIRALSPDTGFADVDFAAKTSDALARGEQTNIKANYLMPMADRNYLPAEKNLMFSLGEASSNIRPDVPEHVIAAAGGRLSATEEQVRAQMAAALPKLAAEHGVDLVAGRAETIIDGAIAAKQSDSRWVENLHKAGIVDETNIGQKVIDNHMPHVRDPRFIGMKQADEIEQAVLPKGAQKPFTADPTRQRKFVGSVQEANAAIEDKFGPEFKDFFITDPHMATAMRELQSQKLIRDSALMDVVSKYGVRMSPSDARQAGRAFIMHPEFQGKSIVIPGGTGGGEAEAVRMSKLQDVAFPKDIAAKMNYRFGATTIDNMTGFLGQSQDVFNFARGQLKSLNGILRSTAFMSESMLGRNSVDNLVKARVAGVGIDALRGAISSLFSETRGIKQGIARAMTLFPDADRGFQAAGNLMGRAGRFYSAKEFSDLATQFGIVGANSFREGVSDFLTQGKGLTASQVAASPGKLGLKGVEQVAQNLMHHVVVLGEHGENLTRLALFRQKMMDGYEPAAAAAEVTKYLFDYTKNSPLTDAARFFMPFVQHPLKTALIAPELIGKAPGVYNAVHFTLPHVMAAAFHDPVSQAAINTVLPDRLKLKDAIAGPILPGNTQLASLFTNPKSGQSMGELMYFTPQVGMSILNHWDYTSQAAREHAQNSNYGLAPPWAAMLHFVQQKDNFGKPLEGSAAWNNMFWEGILGNVAMPNTFKLLKQTFGIGDPKSYQPTTALIANAAWGTFGGFTNLDEDFHKKILSLNYQRADLMKQGAQAISRESRSMSKQNEYSIWATQKGSSILPTSNHEIFAETVLKQKEIAAESNAQQGQAQAAGSMLRGSLSPHDFVGRVKNIDQTLDQVNHAYQFSMQRYLQMSAGAKSSAEARAKAGVGK